MPISSPIIIVPGDPKSVFLEIFIKTLKKIKIYNPIILVVSKELLKNEMKNLNYRKKIIPLDKKNINSNKLKNNCINLINAIWNL